MQDTPRYDNLRTAAPDLAADHQHEFYACHRDDAEGGGYVARCACGAEGGVVVFPSGWMVVEGLSAKLRRQEKD